MKAALTFLLLASATLLLGFVVHDMLSFRWGALTAASSAPRQLWNALAEALAWGKEYKEGTTVVFVTCVIALYISKTPTVKKQ